MESNVASYYDSLTSEGITSERNQQTTAQITSAKERTLQQLQDRGFTNTGMIAQIIANSNSTEAIMLANNAYTANKDVWQQKTAFMQGIALPQKQQTQAGMSTASARVSTAYGNLSGTQMQRASTQMQVEQFNETNKNTQLNQAIGMVGSIAGAYMGGGMGGMGAAPSPSSSAPTTGTQNFQFKSKPIDYNVIPTGTRIT